MTDIRQASLFEDSELPRPGDEPVRELWSLVFLDEVPPADSVVRLTSSARNLVDQDPVQLPENRVVAPEDAQERLVESAETFPGTAVGSVAGDDLFDCFEQALAVDAPDEVLARLLCYGVPFGLVG